MKTILNKEKARELSDKYEKIVDYSVEQCLIEMAEWKDEEHAREKQQWIKEAAEWLKHNIYDYFYWIEMEGESEANIKDTLFDDFKKYAEERL